MLATLSPRAVVMGVASGGLVATVIGLAVGSLLSLLGTERGPDIGILTGVVLGFLAGGWIAGRTAPHSNRFHGSVAGLLFAGLLVLLARGSGAPSTLRDILLLCLVGVAVGGLGGWLGGRRRR